MGRGFDLAHGQDRLAHHHPAALGVGLGLADHVAGVIGAVGGLAHRGGDLIEGGGGLFQAGRLLLGAARQIVGGLGDFGRAGADRLGVAADDLDGLLQLTHGGVEVGPQLFVLRRQGVGQAKLQIAFCQLLEA